VIGFNLAERASLASRPLDAAFNLSLDEYQGTPRLSLRLKDLRATATGG